MINHRFDSTLSPRLVRGGSVILATYLLGTFAFKDGRRPLLEKPRPVASVVIKAVKPQPPVMSAAEGPKSQTLILRKGQTLRSLLVANGFHKGADALLQKVAGLADLRKLKPGQAFCCTADAAGAGALSSFSFQTGFDKKVVASLQEGQWHCSVETQTTFAKKRCITGTITRSFYQDALRSGVSQNLLFRIINSLDGVFLTHRQFKGGESFSVFLEEVTNQETGQKKQTKCMLFAIGNPKKQRFFYYYVPRVGGDGFFTESGERLGKSLFQKPIPGARVSSRFGYRFHPILRKTLFHKGVDLDAIKGTPVKAASEGRVLRVCRNGGYGKYILLQHGGGYKTAYAHLDRYSKGLSVGQRIQRGEVIGYVGSTGRATGPHLHFEVIKNNRHINPTRFKGAVNTTLSGQDKDAFLSYVKQVKASLKKASLPVMQG